MHINLGPIKYYTFIIILINQDFMVRPKKYSNNGAWGKTVLLPLPLNGPDCGSTRGGFRNTNWCRTRPYGHGAAIGLHLFRCHQLRRDCEHRCSKCINTTGRAHNSTAISEHEPPTGRNRCITIVDSCGATAALRGSDVDTG
jgi:hypothetical protein